jgi:hypothetical protein
LGSLFIFVNVRLAILRKKYIKTGLGKLLEAIIFAAVTAVVFYMVAYYRPTTCVPNPTIDLDHSFQFYCPTGYYNPFASLIFNTEGGIIR